VNAWVCVDDITYSRASVSSRSLNHSIVFHNFEHASHVTMSAQKLLKRVTAGDEGFSTEQTSPSNLNDYTFGITTDPLTQFAIVFSALIHDVDHTGVPNMQLVKEKAHIAHLYKNKSVAEQVCRLKTAKMGDKISFRFENLHTHLLPL
jgi:hypothetical protein